MCKNGQEFCERTFWLYIVVSSVFPHFPIIFLSQNYHINFTFITKLGPLFFSKMIFTFQFFKVQSRFKQENRATFVTLLVELILFYLRSFIDIRISPVSSPLAFLCENKIDSFAVIGRLIS